MFDVDGARDGQRGHFGGEEDVAVICGDEPVNHAERNSVLTAAEKSS